MTDSLEAAESAVGEIFDRVFNGEPEQEMSAEEVAKAAIRAWCETEQTQILAEYNAILAGMSDGDENGIAAIGLWLFEKIDQLKDTP